MTETFSFVGPPVENVLMRAHEVMPGIEKVLAVFYDDRRQQSRILISNKENGEFFVNPLENTQAIESFEPFRIKSAPVNWFSKDDIPFKIKKKETKPHIEVFSELENTVLLLRFKNDDDGLYDLLFYYFNANTSNFGVSSDSRNLTTEHKTIISQMLYNAVKAQIKEHKENKSMLKMMNNTTFNALHENKILKQKLEDTTKRYEKSLADLCLQYVSDISREMQVSLQLSAEAMHKLIEYEGDINNLKDIIRQAAVFAVTLNMDANTGEIMIESSYINTHFETDYVAGNIVQQQEGIRQQRYSKTRHILDEMENAAELLASRNVKLTSENLAKSLKKPKSAAAISDQLNKHRDRIIKLFEENPGDWAVIRQNFRPIQNIVSK